MGDCQFLKIDSHKPWTEKPTKKIVTYVFLVGLQRFDYNIHGSK